MQNIQAGKASLKVVTPGADPALLSDLLNQISTNPVEVSDGTLTFDEADSDAITGMLSELGIETTPAEAAVQADTSEDPDAILPTDSEEVVAAKKLSAARKLVAAADGDDLTVDPDTDALVAKRLKAAKKLVADAEAEGFDPDAIDTSDAAAVTAAGRFKAAKALIAAVSPAPIAASELYAKAESVLNASGGYQSLLCAGGTEQASWLLVSGLGQPVARIVLASQADAGQLAPIFSSDNYFNMLKAAFEKKGIAATLQSVKAEVITAEEVTPAEMPDVTEISASAIEKYRRNLSMAVQAAQKNLIPNKMKAAAFDALTDAGVEDPESVVEAIFAAADEMFDDLDAQAAEYGDMDESGIAATQKVLATMSVQPAGAKVSAAATAMRARLAATNMPLTASLPAAGLDNQQQQTQLVAGADRTLIQSALKRLV
jgi:hypothetical protein